MPFAHPTAGMIIQIADAVSVRFCNLSIREMTQKIRAASDTLLSKHTGHECIVTTIMAHQTSRFVGECALNSTEFTLNRISATVTLNPTTHTHTHIFSEHPLSVQLFRTIKGVAVVVVVAKAENAVKCQRFGQ